jgi:acyl-CoA thioester hydrolase
MGETFVLRFRVRSYELDGNGHVNGAVYLLWADHGRWECLRRAGVDLAALRASGLGPVNLATTIEYRKELRGDDDVSIDCTFAWPAGKTFRVRQSITSAGELAATVTSISGLLDLDTRRLVPDAAARWRRLAARPALLGLT